MQHKGQRRQSAPVVSGTQVLKAPLPVGCLSRPLLTRRCCESHCFMRMCALMTSSTSSSCEATTGALCSIWRFTDRLS